MLNPESEIGILLHKIVSKRQALGRICIKSGIQLVYRIPLPISQAEPSLTSVTRMPLGKSVRPLWVLARTLNNRPIPEATVTALVKKLLERFTTIYSYR